MSKRIKGITIEINASTTGLDKALQDVNKSSRDINKELRDVNKLLKFNPKDTEILSQKQKLLGDQVSTTREKLDRLKEAEAQVQAQFENGDIGEENYRKFQREIVETESKLKHYENQLKQVSDSHLILSQNLQDAGKKMQDVGKKVSDVGGNLTKKLTVPLAAVGVAAGKLGIDFEASMSEVGAISGATGDDLQKLEDAAREAGATTNKSARDAADALRYMGLAGWDVTESQQALMPMLKLSSAGNMELGRTSDLVTDSMSALGLGIDDLDGYLDILAQASRNSNTDIDALGEAFVVVGGRLNLLGVPAEEAAVALGILGDNGIKGSDAGRGLNAVLTNLTAPTGRAKKALDELNISAFDSSGEFIGLEETFQLVADATAGMTQEQQNQYYSMIAGKEHSKTFNALLGSLGDSWDGLTEDVQNSNGALDEMYDTMTGNTAGAIDNLKSALEELALKIYDNLQPTIESLIGVVQGLTDKFNNLSPETQENIVKIGLLIATIGPLISILGRTARNIGSVIDFGGRLVGNWDKIRGVGSALAGGLGKTVGFIFSPAGAILIGIGAAIAIGVALYKNWDTVKAKAGQLGSYISSKFNQIKTSIEGPINKAKDTVGNAIDKIKGFFNFEFKWPKLKMPKFSISGSMNPATWLTDGVPKLSVKWNKEGAIFTKPTIFNTPLGLQGVGDGADAEAVLPISKLAGILANVMKNMGHGKVQEANVPQQNRPVYVNFYPQSMSEAEMDKAFNYMNRRFGVEI